MNTQTFDSLELGDTTLAAVRSAGYSTPTEIQHRTIPEILAGNDVLATAQTGTGKTAAFVLPMLERISPAGRSKDGHDAAGAKGRAGAKRAVGEKGSAGVKGAASPKALILTPTRELAAQIQESIRVYGRNSRLRSVALFGGASRNRQIGELRSHPEVVVATPGRLLDLVSDGYLGLKDVSYLVLDEADRMLDMGFIPDVRKIVAKAPPERQTLLFSATMPDDINLLARDFLRDPARIEAEAGELSIERIDQSVMHVDQGDKLELLPKLIRDRQMFRVLVFTRTKHRARKVSKLLGQQNLASDAIHGDKSQAARTRALDAFKDGKIQVLVATDVASRGIDVDDITHVVNFELPNEPETYVHRIGRTARAGAQGNAISFCDTTEMPYVRNIERLMGLKLEIDKEQPFHQERHQQTRRGAPPRSGRSSQGSHNRRRSRKR